MSDSILIAGATWTDRNCKPGEAENLYLKGARIAIVWPSFCYSIASRDGRMNGGCGTSMFDAKRRAEAKLLADGFGEAKP